MSTWHHSNGREHGEPESSGESQLCLEERIVSKLKEPLKKSGLYFRHVCETVSNNGSCETRSLYIIYHDGTMIYASRKRCAETSDRGSLRVLAKEKPKVTHSKAMCLRGEEKEMWREIQQ